MVKRWLLFPCKVFFLGFVLVWAGCSTLILKGTPAHSEPSDLTTSEPVPESAPEPIWGPPNIYVDKNAAISTELNNGYEGYTGKVVKVTPKNGQYWEDWSKPIYCDLEEYSGSYRITVSMSVWAEKASDKQGSLYSGPPDLGILIENGTGSFNDFGDSAVELQTGRWVDITFSKIVDLTAAGNRRIYVDGLNEHEGLVNLTLYIRNFTVTLQKFDGKKYIALTFDDAPSDIPGALHTTELLDKLDDLHIKATFFLVGMRIDALDPKLDQDLDDSQRDARRAARQAVVRRMFEAGHEVANHSYTHDYLGGRTPEDEGIDPDDIPDVSGITALAAFDSKREWPLNETVIDHEIQACNDAIQKAVYGDTDYMNHPPVSRLFRTPFTADAKYAEHLLNIAREKGLPLIYGSGSDDYDSSLSAQQIADNIIKMAEPGAIIINHDPRWAVNIVEALAIALPRLKDEGFEIVTLSEMAEKMGITLIPGQVYESFD